MRVLISLTLGLIAALFATGMEERAFNQVSGWLALIVFASVATISLHVMQVQRRHL